MKIRTSYPGQAVQELEAPPHIVEHFRTKDWPLPFVEIIEMPTTSKFLADAIRKLGGEPYSYSGRGMFGKQCIAVNDMNVHELMMELGSAPKEMHHELTYVRRDSMGKGFVIYWPSIEFKE